MTPFLLLFLNYITLATEFKEEVIQELLHVPPNLEVRQVRCSRLAVSVRAASASSDPGPE